MKIQLLIDSIVQQTTVLIAKLATTGGARSPLAHIANQVILVESGLLFCSGAGLDAVYRLATEQELRTIYNLDGQSGLEELIWSIVFCRGPIRRDHVAKIGALSEDALDRALQNLTETDRINLEKRDDGVYLFSNRFQIEQSDHSNWEASVYDHFHAVVRTICNRLEPGVCDSRYKDSIGGSTYTFDVGPGHPHEVEVLSLLRDFRERCGHVRHRVSAYNQKHMWGLHK